MYKKITRALLLSVGLLFCSVICYYVWHMRSSINMIQQTLKKQTSVTPAPIAHTDNVDAQILPHDNAWLRIQRKVKDTVVQIFVNTVEFNWLEPYKTPKQGMSTGTGFFINKEGDIISNYHVVAQAVNIQIQIPSLGLERFNVELIGASPERDIALLRLTEPIKEKIIKRLKQIPFLTLGNSDEILRSHEVLALGYPLGQSRLKSTLGIVSGRERLGNFGYIQITSPLNPGNSGGPSLNTAGDVIGINTAGVIGAQNVGYIIPINEVKTALVDLKSNKLLRKPILGCLLSYSSPEMISYLNNPSEGGWYVAKVFENSLFQKIGIKDGDMIYEIDGLKVDAYGEINVSWSEDKVSFSEVLNRYNLNDSIEFLIYRKGKPYTFTLPFETKHLPAIRIVYPEFEPETTDYEIFGGLVVMNLNLNHVAILLQNCPELIRYSQLEHQQKEALIVTQVIPNSQAYESRVLSPGRIIEEVNEIKVTNLKEFREAIMKSKTTGFVSLKTSEKLCTIFSVEKVTEEEPILSSRYFYKPSNLIKALNNG